jgi:hypothetical protein
VDYDELDPVVQAETMVWEAQGWAAGADIGRWVDDRLRERMLAGETGFDDVTRARLLRG